MEPTPIVPVTSAAPKQRRRWWRWLLVGVLAMVVGGWFGRFWLGELLAESLRAELAARGFHVSWKSAAFLPGQGISFEEFHMHRDADHTASLMTWDQVTIRKGPTGWKSLHLHAAGSELVLGEGAESLRMTDLAMELDIDREGVSVENWNGLAHGLRVDVTGAVLFAKLDALRKKDLPPEVEPAVPTVPEKIGLEGADLAFLRTVGEWMEARQLGKREVRLAVSFREREAAPGYLLKADLDGADMEWRGQHFPTLGVTMEWPLTGKPEPIQVTRIVTSPEEKGQKLALSIDLQRKEIRVKAESAVLHLVPVLGAAVPSLADVFKQIHVEQASHWQVAGVIPWGGTGKIKLAGRVAMAGSFGLAPGAGKQIAVTELQTAFDLDGQALALKDMAGSVWGGRVRITEAQVNLKTHDWEVKGAELQGIQLPQVNHSLGWKNGPTGVLDGSWLGRGGSMLASVRAQGSVQIADAEFPFPSVGGLRQTTGKSEQIEFEKLQAGFALNDQTLVLRGMAGRLWGGSVRIDNAKVNVMASTWEVNGAEIKEVRIPLMRSGLGLPDKQQHGMLHGTWQGGGGLRLTDIMGQGALRITDEGFNKLPLTGPLALVFVGIAPGFAEETTSRLATDYALHGGTLTLSNLKVDSAVTEIQAAGDLNLVTQHAKLTARAKLRGIAGLPTALLGRLLTLDGEGPFSDIQWRLRYALGLEQVAGTGVAIASDVVKEGGKVARGILSFPGRLLKQNDKPTPTKPSK